MFISKKENIKKEIQRKILVSGRYKKFKSLVLQAPKQQSDWRPALGYENVDVTPLPSHPTTNQLVQVSKGEAILFEIFDLAFTCFQPCFVPSGMSTEPLNFPNLVTGFEVC
jgi:hypothetical protein